MVDVFSKEQRSAVMSRVKGRGNKATELKLIAILREHKLSGWRRNSQIVGRPDFVFKTAKLAVFVDGCFWHGCPIHGSAPSSNSEFWMTKLTRNRERDRFVNKSLRNREWKVIRVWQHELHDPQKVARRISQALSHKPQNSRIKC